VESGSSLEELGSDAVVSTTGKRMDLGRHTNGVGVIRDKRSLDSQLFPKWDFQTAMRGF